MTGIDIDEESLALARHRAPGVRFERLDMRAVRKLERPFDGALSLWQSFGYFSCEENNEVLRSVLGVLRPGGRFLLDVFHADYFRERQGFRARLPPGVASIEDRLDADRLISQITYDDGSGDRMNFELFTPDQLADRAAHAGFELLESCCWWDAKRRPSSQESRFQLVLGRPL